MSLCMSASVERGPGWAGSGWWRPRGRGGATGGNSHCSDTHSWRAAHVCKTLNNKKIYIFCLDNFLFTPQKTSRGWGRRRTDDRAAYGEAAAGFDPEETADECILQPVLSRTVHAEAERSAEAKTGAAASAGPLKQEEKNLLVILWHGLANSHQRLCNCVSAARSMSSCWLRSTSWPLLSSDCTVKLRPPDNSW